MRPIVWPWPGREGRGDGKRCVKSGGRAGSGEAIPRARANCRFISQRRNRASPGTRRAAPGVNRRFEPR